MEARSSAGATKRSNQVMREKGPQDLQLFQAEAAFGAGLFLSLTQTLFLLPFAQISKFFFDEDFDENLFATKAVWRWNTVKNESIPYPYPESLRITTILHQ